MAETKRKLMALGAIRLEQDQTTAQLQVQKVRSGELGGWLRVGQVICPWRGSVHQEKRSVCPS